MIDLAVLAFPNVDPVAFSIGPFAVRWYALAYIAGCLAGHNCICNGMYKYRIFLPAGTVLL